MAERPPHEIELKLRVPAHRVAAVEAAVRGRAQAPRVHLQASYVDTPGFDLAANGIGWRIRREGRQWVQTVKADVAAGGDGMRRFEDNVAIPARERDVVDATRHSEHPAGVRLLEVLEGLDDTPTERFRTDIWRVARVVRVPGGRVELALDRGEIVAGDHRVAVSELEVELVSGAPLAVIETARNLAGLPNASSTEFGPCDEPVIGLMTEWQRGNSLEIRKEGGDLGGTMRLGAYPAVLAQDSRVAQIYGATEISERHRHRYEVNIGYRDALEKAGLRVSGTSPDGVLPEIVEIPEHPWFVGVQFHPELKSKPFEPHPLFRSFVKAALDRSRLV